MRSFKQLTFNDRLKLEVLLKAGHKIKEIAKLLGFHKSTIYREIKRGTYIALNSDLTTEERYSPDIAQKKKDEVLAAKGPEVKIGKNFDFSQRIEDIITKEHYSPSAALAKLKNEGYKFTICVSTLYSYIDKGIFLKLTNKNLPVKKNNDKRDYKKVRPKRTSKGESIEKRDKKINTRQEFGHWEMDTVVGKRGVSKKSLLVLTERKTRKELIFLLERHTAENVVKALDKLERELGASFQKIFKTITVDNGSEFMDCIGMQKSVRIEGNRTTIYYCHPYSSWERGSNENQNKLIRYHLPKGINFDDKTLNDINYIEKWINNYPRRLFEFKKTSEELFAEELKKLDLECI